MPTNEELAYMAGIVDGEGSICIFTYCNNKATKYHAARTSLSVVNTDTRLLDWIISVFGGSYRELKRRIMKPNSKPCYIWQVTHKSAIPIVELLLPYLVLKKEQGELLIAFSKTNKKFGARKAPPEYIAERRKIIERVSFLNTGAYLAS